MKRKMQKYLSFVMAIVLALAFCGCGAMRQAGQPVEKDEGINHENGQQDNVSGETVKDILPENPKDEGADKVSGKEPSTQISSEQQAVIDEFTYEYPCEANWYIVEVPGGMEAVYDLNGDGVEEILYYATCQAQNGNRQVSSMLINQTEFGGIFQGVCVQEQHFGVVDLEEDDPYFELALYDSVGGAEKTHFFRYDGEKLVKLGTVSGYIDMASIDSGEAHLDGNGNIYSMFELQLLENWEAPGLWALNDTGRIQKVSEELYSPLSVGNEKIKVQKELKLYMERNTQSEYITVLPSDKTVDFQATDDKEWLLVSVGKKTIGWMNKQSLESLGILSDS